MDLALTALPAATQQRFDAWLAGAVERTGLAVRDVRKGVQSVSTVYVEGRQQGRLGARASEGPARRAALATYYAPLHYLVAFHAARALGLGAAERILDLGCGTGACGAAVACATQEGRPRASLVGIDRSGWSLREARHTWAAFGIRARGRRGVLPGSLPRPRRGDLLVAGFVLNECDTETRQALLDAHADALAAGAQVLILEPLAGRIAPWWDEAARRLAAGGAQTQVYKARIDRPAWIAELDRASGLDHQEIGARVLYRPAGPSTGPA